MRGGWARRSRRESCHAHNALPARFGVQKRLRRASVRVSQSGGGGPSSWLKKAYVVTAAAAGLAMSAVTAAPAEEEDAWACG